MSDYQLMTAILANMIYMVVLYKLIHVFLVSKRPMKQEMLLYLAAYVVLTVAYLIWKTPLVTMLTNIVVILGLTCIYPVAWPRRFIVTAFVFCTIMLCEVTILEIVRTLGFSHFTSYDNREYFIVQTMCKIANYLVALWISKLEQLREEDALPIGYWLTVLAIPVLTIIAVHILFVTVNNVGSAGLCIIVLLLFFINGLVLYLYDQIIALFQEKLVQQEIGEQNRIFIRQLAIEQEAMDKMRQLRHDWNNLLQPILFQLSNADYQEAEANLRQLVGELNYSERIMKSGDPMIAAIVNYKLANAQAEGIEISCTADLPSDLSERINVQDVSVLLGNLLDNALRAVHEDTKSDKKYISLKLSILRGALLMIVANSYDGQLALAHGEYQTTKADKTNHGLGLKSVRRIVETYQGDMDIETDAQAFKVRLKLFLRDANS